MPNPQNQRKICATALHQAVSRGKLLQTGKQAALFAIRANAAIFTLAYPLPYLSLVNKGKARFIAAATVWQFSTPYPLFAALIVVESDSAVKKPNRKAFTMQNANSIHTIQIQTKRQSIQADFGTHGLNAVQAMQQGASQSSIKRDYGTQGLAAVAQYNQLIAL